MYCLILSSLRICSHALMDSWFPFFMAIRLLLSVIVSKLNLYYFKKTSARSFHLLILVLFSLIYQLKADYKPEINRLAFFHRG
jgi:hypothetical protein